MFITTNTTVHNGHDDTEAPRVLVVTNPFDTPTPELTVAIGRTLNRDRRSSIE